jgi:hypothetical protein
MAKAVESKVSPKMIGLILIIVVAVGLAIWQGTKSLAPSATDTSFRAKQPAPPESARPAGHPAAPAPSKDEKTGAGE